MAEPTPDEDAPAAMMAVIHSLSLDAARVPWWAIREAMGIDDPADERPADEVLSLIEDGWVSEWSDDDGPGVILTPWAAERFRLRLTADGGRWADVDAYRERHRYNWGTLTTTEADLTGEDDTPLDQHDEGVLLNRVGRRDPGDGARHAPRESPEAALHGLLRRAEPAIGVGYKALLELLAEASGFGDWSRGRYAPSGPVVLMGDGPWPLPGQEKGPRTPRPLPSDWEAARGKGHAYVGPCRACGDEGRYLCDCCDRGPKDHLIGHDLKVKIAASKRPRLAMGKDDKAGGLGKVVKSRKKAS